jgi:hypothetical protein
MVAAFPQAAIPCGLRQFCIDRAPIHGEMVIPYCIIAKFLLFSIILSLGGLPKPGLIPCQPRKGQEMEEVVNLLFGIFHANIEKKRIPGKRRTKPKNR